MRVCTVLLRLFCLITYTRRQKSVIITETRILSEKLHTITQKSIRAGKIHIRTWKLPVLSRKPAGSFRDNIGFSQIGSFSKGMKMKLSIICAMAHKPKLLILDEATTGLDPVVRDEMLDLFLEFIQDEECSIFFSSHITSDIQKIADYVILIHQGKIIFEEQKDDLVYHFGIVKCGREKFASISPDDYIIHRVTNVSVECLVRDKEAIRRKYKDIVVDNATLEDIMLFYIKGGAA